MKIGELEAIIFAAGKEGVEIGHLQKVFDIDKKEILALLDALKERYAHSDFGIELKRVETTYFLGTKEIVYPSMIQYYSKPKKLTLTQVQIETLAMIAYEQPITKQRIEEIRGVKSDYAINKLVEYGLIEEGGRLDAPGKPILFKTTEAFLKQFGLESIKQIPPITKEELAQLEAEVSNQLASCES